MVLYINPAACSHSRLCLRLLDHLGDACDHIVVEQALFPDGLKGWPLLVDDHGVHHYGDHAFARILDMAAAATAGSQDYANPAANIQQDGGGGAAQRHGGQQHGGQQHGNQTPGALDHGQLGASGAVDEGIVCEVGQPDQFAAILKTYKVPK